MSDGARNPGKEVYQQLRGESWEQLWQNEVPRYNRASPTERSERVGLIRAVGVVFMECGPPGLAGEVRGWLRGLLGDPDEKVRRYAVNALPKLGAGEDEESLLLNLLQQTGNERERKFLAGALEKIGGGKTLEVTRGVLPQTEQKARASVARNDSPGRVLMDRVLGDCSGLRIHLRGRNGLEGIVRAETEADAKGKFRVVETSAGLVVIEPTAPFSLADLYSLRCFGTAGVFLGVSGDSIDDLAALVASPLACRVMQTLTEGPARYRLDFVSKGHRRGAVRALANRAYALCPEILNDARSALWAMDIHSSGRGESVELRPRWSPDPRFAYRRRDVPAASHPPLAAAMAWLAGKADNEIVWDPFCGSGVELIERALRGGVTGMFGTDLSPEAVGIARENFAAADARTLAPHFHCRDFRDHATIRGLEPGRVSLILTNPPMGQRVPIPDLRGLIADLLNVAATALRPGGRLVFANPIRGEMSHPLLRRKLRQVVDMGGFDCRLEMYVKVGRAEEGVKKRGNR